MANLTFEEYFETRAVLSGAMGVGGDEKLTLRGGTVFRESVVEIKAHASMADSAVETVLAAVDTWAMVENLIQGPTTAAFSYATSQFTYLSPNREYPSSLKAKASLTKVLAGAQDYEIGLFVNDVLIGNGMRVTVVDGETAFVSCEVLHTLITGDVVDLRVRARSGDDDITVRNAQLTIR